MNFLYLSPNFPPQFYLFCVQLARQGVRVLAIGEAPLDDLRPELREALTEYYQVHRLGDEEQLSRACAYFIWKYGRIDRVESHVENWLPLEAALREDFNVPIGPRRAETFRLQKKSLMKEIYIKNGLPVARGELLRDRAQTDAFVKRVGYPIIAKPDIGVGAWATYRINNKAELDRFFEEKAPVEYFLEEFIFGDLFTFDGISNRDNEMVYCTSHQSGTGVLELVADNVDLSYVSLRDIPDRLMDYGKRCIKAFNVREKFFHFEFLRRTSDGEFIAMEINCRPPGGFTTDIMNFTSDIDIYLEYANVVVKNKFEAPIERKYHCAHIARRYEKTYRYTHEQIVERYGSYIAAHIEVPTVFAPVMGNVAYLVRSPNLEDVKHMIKDIQALG